MNLKVCGILSALPFSLDDVVTVCKFHGIPTLKALKFFEIISQDEVDSDSSKPQSDLKHSDSTELMVELFGRIELLQNGLKANIARGQGNE